MGNNQESWEGVLQVTQVTQVTLPLTGYLTGTLQVIGNYR